MRAAPGSPRNAASGAPGDGFGQRPADLEQPIDLRTREIARLAGRDAESSDRLVAAEQRDRDGALHPGRARALTDDAAGVVRLEVAGRHGLLRFGRDARHPLAERDELD